MRAALAEVNQAEQERARVRDERLNELRLYGKYDCNIRLHQDDIPKVMAYLRMVLGAYWESTLSNTFGTAFFWDDHGIMLDASKKGNTAGVRRIFHGTSLSDQGKRAIDGVWQILDNQ